MNNLSSSFKKICFFFFFFLTACGSIQPQKNPPTATPTILPATNTLTPTTSPTVTQTPPPPTLTLSPTATIEMPTMIVTPAPTDRPGNYIIYSRFPDQDVLWAINPEKPIPFRLPDTSNLWNNWSPSHQFWLYSDDEWFYKIPASPTNHTTSVHAIYNHSQFKSIVSETWLTDDVLLFEDYQGEYPYGAADLYSLNIPSGVATKLIDSKLNPYEMLGAVFPDEKKWLKLDFVSGAVSIMDENGNPDAFFVNFSIAGPTVPYFNPKNPFVKRLTKLDRYLFMAQEHADPKSTYKLWVVSNHETPYMLLDSMDENIYQFSLSPDEKYVAVRMDGLPDEHIYIFSMDTLQLRYKWVYPSKTGGVEFVWSPDSEKIAFEYDGGGSPDGIQVMDIQTGETKVIVQKGVAAIQGWEAVK